MSINNLKLKFLSNNKEIKFSDEVIHVIFFDKKNDIHLKPKWFGKKETILLENKKFLENIENLSFFRSNFGNFIIVKNFSIESKYENFLEIENLGGKTFNLVKNLGFKEVNVYIDDVISATKYLYGLFLSSYKFKNYKSKKTDNKLKTICIKSDNYSKINKEFKTYESLISGVFFTRDLVWKPANILFPKSFVDECKKLSKQGVKINIYNESQLKKIGMHALLGVGQGSSKQSYVVCMEWKGGSKNKNPLTIIGKGVCFDSGGLSLKPPKSMEDMKWDMGGAGVTVGLMDAVSRAKLNKNVIGVVGLVENMPDGNAQRPGDVVKSFSGKTIEVLNTDAEGRLVLADLLSWTEKKYKPAFMINLATLTGAIIISLGSVRAGLFSNNDSLNEKISLSGEITGDYVWRMPLDKEYDDLLKTEIADMKNIGGPGAGSITAACFLKRHVVNTPWAHLDIAGVTWNNKSKPTTPVGASGWGVKLLFDLIKKFDYKI